MDATAQRIESPALVTAPDADRVALFRLVADGRHHAFTDLLARLPGPTTIERVRAQLDALKDLGMPMRIDDQGVVAHPCIPLDAAAIRNALDDTVVAGATRWDVRVEDAIDSTSSALMQTVRRADGPLPPALIATDFQRAGRGRMGRGWSSPPGASLTVSFAITLRRGLAQLDGVTLVCGLAVHRVAAAHGASPRLKWPNDVLVDGAKLAGILVEAHATRGGTTLVIGIGMNVAGATAVADPGSLPRAALPSSGNPAIDRNRLVVELARGLEAEIGRFDDSGFAPFAARWNAEDAFRDQRIALVSPPGAMRAGLCRGVDEGGALILEVDGVRQRIIAGDVSLRPMPFGVAAA